MKRLDCCSSHCSRCSRSEVLTAESAVGGSDVLISPVVMARGKLC